MNELNKNFTLHQNFMNKVHNLALEGQGRVSPNPLVGCIIVKNNKVIGEGYHLGPGLDHAEIMALKSCKKNNENPEGAILYSNLEPCCHTNKRTPPCVPEIIKAKIKTVVISNIDPNPCVSGMGISQLKKANINVVGPILQSEGEKLNKIFFHFQKTQLPYVHLKVAQTLDGKIASQTNHSKWISNEQSRLYVHHLRYLYDGIVIGRNTLNYDNPQLTIRFNQNKTNKDPWKIIFGKKKNISTNLSLFQGDPSKILIYENDDSNQFLNNCLKDMASKNITSILVEGGSQLLTSFIQSKLFNELSIFVAPKILGNGPSFFQSSCINTINEAISFNHTQIKQMGADTLIEVYN